MRTNLISMTVGMWITSILLYANQELGQTGTWIFIGLCAAMTAGLIWDYVRTSKKKKSENAE
ncbi:hypothetical protein ACXJY6_00965 [Vibrio sp. RC27]